MVMYSDYVSDFPSRCAKLLEELHHETQCLGVEVTHLLSITAVGLMVPHERLKKGSRISHPSGDHDRYKKAVTEYNNLLDERFLSSPLWADGASTWRKGKVQNVEAQAPDFVKAFARAESIKLDDKVRTVIGIMRNALAHGNIVTGPQSRKINDIMFLSADKYPAFRFVAVGPEDLHTLVTKYFEFLRHLDLGSGRLVIGDPKPSRTDAA